MIYMVCPRCSKKRVRFRHGQIAGEDRYRCDRKECGWFAFADEDDREDKEQMSLLRAANPSEADRCTTQEMSR